MKKNDEIIVEIVDITSEGEGLGKADGFPLFIKDSLPGDVVKARITKVKKTYGYARLMEVLTPSADRCAARCPLARPCGGCQLQEYAYPAQLAFKKAKVENNLKRIGGLDVPVEPVLGMEEPWRYRNKAQLPIGYDKNGRLVAGFYAGRTHNIMPQEDCLLGAEENAAIVKIVLSFMEEHGISAYNEEIHTGLVRHLLIRKGFHTAQWMVCLIINGTTLPFADDLVARLSACPGMTSISLNINREPGNVIMGRDMVYLYGPSYIEDNIGDLRFRISPQSFFQVNPVQTERLYQKALEFAGLTGQEDVWDLYCGIGTISLFLAQKAGRVRGVEIIPAAIENARENAALNNLTNTEFFVGSAETILPAIYEKEHCHADVMVVDPPRKGCDEALLSTMVSMQPDRIVYVSCDSATLARDLKWLSANGYRVEKVQPVDMFPQTSHVETVCLLSRKAPV